MASIDEPFDNLSFNQKTGLYHFMDSTDDGTIHKPKLPERKISLDDYESLPSDKLSHIMMAGATAGVMEHCIMFPFDTIKTRMQSLTASSSELGRGMGDVFRGMVAQEGVLRPLRGVNAVILGAAPAHALYFSCYEFLKENFTNKTLINNNVGYGLAGGIATMLHDGIMTPADVVKQRLQMYNSPYRSVLETIRTVYATEGLAAFYRSYTTQLAMNVPFQSIHFITYEVMQTISNPSRSYNPVAHMISGAISGGVAAAITTPLDVCKTFLNTQQSQEKISGLFAAIRSVYKLGGPFGFFRGLQARILYQMPSTAICWSTYEFFKYLLSVNPALPLLSASEETEARSPTTTLATRRNTVDEESPSILPHPPGDNKAGFSGVTKFAEKDCWSSGNPYNKPALAFTTVHSGEKTEFGNTRLLDSSSAKLPIDYSFRSF